MNILFLASVFTFLLVLFAFLLGDNIQVAWLQCAWLQDGGLTGGYSPWYVPCKYMLLLTLPLPFYNSLLPQGPCFPPMPNPCKNWNISPYKMVIPTNNFFGQEISVSNYKSKQIIVFFPFFSPFWLLAHFCKRKWVLQPHFLSNSMLKKQNFHQNSCPPSSPHHLPVIYSGLNFFSS